MGFNFCKESKNKNKQILLLYNLSDFYSNSLTNHSFYLIMWLKQLDFVKRVFLIMDAYVLSFAFLV